MDKNALTLSQYGDETYRFRRHFKKTDHNPIPLRWQAVLAYHLAGKPVKEISKLTGYAIPTIYGILANKNVVAVRQKLLAATQQEFEALFSKVVENIREQLNSSDPAIQLAAQNQWFKATGKYAPRVVDKSTHITAEDVVFQLLNVGKIDE